MDIAKLFHVCYIVGNSSPGGAASGFNGSAALPCRIPPGKEAAIESEGRVFKVKIVAGQSKI
jgi:hypothetical protein